LALGGFSTTPGFVVFFGISASLAPFSRREPSQAVEIPAFRPVGLGMA